MKKPRVLVTGASGFTGHYVCKELKKDGFEVFNLSKDGVNGKKINICAYDDVLQCIEQIKPESVVHLAGVAHVNHEVTADFYRINVEGSLNLLNALEVVNCIKGNVVLASSANVYGNAYQNQAIDETFPAKPNNDYSVSKLAMEHMAQLRMDRLPITIVRPFNYTGNGQSEEYLIPKIVKAFKDRSNTLNLGNIDVYRDYSDVRDVARYYSALVKRGTSGEILNICSGEIVSINEIIHMLKDISGCDIKVNSIEQLQRKNDLRYLQGNTESLRKTTLISPKYSIYETLAWMFNSQVNSGNVRGR